MIKHFIEACCENLESVAHAVEAGAGRIELCEHLSCGGLTPSEDMIRMAMEIAGKIPVNVLVRPRPGNFVYSPDEAATMIDSIHKCKEAGVNGVVIGALRDDGRIDKELMGLLIREARPMHITFHRAFDVCSDPCNALEVIIRLGAERLLTSGHKASAYEGRFALRDLVIQAAGRIIIMPGCGITPGNIEEIATITGASEFHGSRII